MKFICHFPLNMMLYLLWIIALMHQYGQCDGTIPKITEHPEDTFVARNDPATLRCQAEGDPDPKITWWKDGTAVETATSNPKSHRVILPSGSLFFLRAAYSRRENDGGVYWCNATNSQGSAVSKNVTLTVAVLRDKFRVEPDDVGVVKGGTATLNCSPPKGTPNPTVYWKKDGKIVDVENDKRMSQDLEGSLTIREVIDSDEGKYQCVAKNFAGTRTSEEGFLLMQVKPYIIKHPENVSAVAGEDIRLGCVAAGKPQPELRWSRKSHKQIPAARALEEDNNVLIIRHANPEDQDVYICTAENSAGAVHTSAQVQVNSPPIFLVQPTDQKVAENAPAVLDCIAAGNPTPTLFWMKEGEPNIILPGTHIKQLTVTPEGSLRIANVDAMRDSGWYSCAAVSESGSSLSRAEVRVSKETDHPPPIIELGPVNQTLPIKTSANLPCDASDHKTIVWLKDGVPISTLATETRIYVDGDNALTIKDLKLSDSGLYTCQARSVSGQAVWSAALRVADPKLEPDFEIRSMPYLTQFPSSPSKPSLVNVTDTAITLFWDKPHRIGGSKLKGYQLDYYTLKNPSHWITINDVFTETYTIRNLEPRTTVTVLVRARNEHGLSPPSPVSKPLSTLPPSLSYKLGSAHSSEMDVTNSFVVRQRLSQRIIEIIEAVVIGPRKVKLRWELHSAKRFVEGYHIHIRDMSSKDPHFDVVTLSGGGTRSHTLSDLRPNTEYSIFLLPYHQQITGNPSNLKTVTTKEDVPASPPESVAIEIYNETVAIVTWRPPPKRDLQGELKGFKLLIDCDLNGIGSEIKNGTSKNGPPLSLEASSQLNFTLDSDTHTLTFDISINTTYHVQVAAYNRQGIGPFSEQKTLKVDPELFSHSKISLHNSETDIIGNDKGLDIGSGGHVLGTDNYNLILQEVWFAMMISAIVILLIIIFGAVICVKRRKSFLKNSLGNYNDHDHLWFDPNWKHISSNSSTCNNRQMNGSAIGNGMDTNENDPMAAMLENNAKNKNATNIFLNQLHNIKTNEEGDNGAPEYAEVDGMVNSKQSILISDINQGPYATTTLVNTPRTTSNHGTTATASIPNGIHSNVGLGGSNLFLASMNKSQHSNMNGKVNITKNGSNNSRQSDNECNGQYFSSSDEVNSSGSTMGQKKANGYDMMQSMATTILSETTSGGGNNGLQDKDTFGLKSKQSSNSIDASQSASSTTSHSGSNSSRNNQNRNSRNKGNSGSLSPPNQLPPPPPITSSIGSTQNKYISNDSEIQSATANSSPAMVRMVDGNAIMDARSYNRSLMSMGELGRPPLPPDPPIRGHSSYNGVRVGSMVSFGANGPISRVYPFPVNVNPNGGSNPNCNNISSQLQQNPYNSHSHYSVPGIFYPPTLDPRYFQEQPEIVNSDTKPTSQEDSRKEKDVSEQNSSQTDVPPNFPFRIMDDDQQYESASIIYGPGIPWTASPSPLHQATQAGIQCSPYLGYYPDYQNGVFFEDHGFETDEYCDEQDWDWESYLSVDDDDNNEVMEGDTFDSFEGCDDANKKNQMKGKFFKNDSIKNQQEGNEGQNDDTESLYADSEFAEAIAKAAESSSSSKLRSSELSRKVHQNGHLKRKRPEGIIQPSMRNHPRGGRPAPIADHIQPSVTSVSANATPLNRRRIMMAGRKPRHPSGSRPTSVCSTDSNYSSINLSQQMNTSSENPYGYGNSSVQNIQSYSSPQHIPHLIHYPPPYYGGNFALVRPPSQMSRKKMIHSSSPYKNRLIKGGGVPVSTKNIPKEQQIYSTFKPPASVGEERNEDGLKNSPIAVTTENDIPRRNGTNGDSKGVTEHYKDVKLDKVGEFQSKSEEDDQKWKSNSLTKTRSGQTTSNFSSNNLQRNIAQRACSSEQSSPQLERRSNQITPLNYINGESNNQSGTHQNLNGIIDHNKTVNIYNPKSYRPVVTGGETENTIITNNVSNKNSSSSNVSEFAQVSEDMNELVYHLNSIQNDISELAGKNISLCENKT